MYPRRIEAAAAPLLAEFDVRGGGPKAHASSLSGGNQQKVIIAREISRDPAVLVASQPTRGIDVGAIEYVHQRLIAERDEGRAILLVSLELEEVLSLSDRILVIFEGRIVAEFAPGVGREELGEAMLGIGAAQMSTATPPRSATGPPKPIKQDPGRLRHPGLAVRSGGFLTSLATTVLAFLIGGVVVAGDRPQPAHGLQGDLQRHRAQLVLPVGHAARDRENAAFNLQQTLLLTTTLIFAVAGGRLRLPLRPVQHRRPGPVDRRRDRVGVGGLVVRRHARPRAHRARDRARGPRGRRVGRASRASSRRRSAPTR